MMNLYLLRPIEGHPAWKPWYDKAFGFVIRAESAEQARAIAAGPSTTGDWDDTPGDEGSEAWLSPTSSTCELLSKFGRAGVIMRDFASA